jgi:hypothetical protein
MQPLTRLGEPLPVPLSEGTVSSTGVSHRGCMQTVLL